MKSPVDFRLVSRFLLSVAAAACLMPNGLLAQSSAADPEAYRQAKIAATEVFLNRDRSNAERLAATKDLGYPDDSVQTKLLVIGADRTEDDVIRWEALRRVQYDEGYRNVVLKILADADDGGEELNANLIEDMSRRTTFIPPAQIRQRIQAVLRKLIDDERDRVRLYAYKALIANNDQMAVNVLAESLRNATDFPIPLVEAIELLDQDGSINHIAAIRPYLRHTDPQVQAKAVRALSVDPQSRPRIVELAKDAGTPTEIRLNALRALAREDDDFLSYAIPLVEEVEGDPKVRNEAMRAVAGRMNYYNVAPADQVRFAIAVEKIAADRDLETDDANKMMESAEKLRFHLRKAFPEVQKYFENR